MASTGRSASLSPPYSSEMGEQIDKAKRYDRGIRIWGAHGQV